ncbi:MAG TPA: hypothetical protein VKE69_07785 [Planctomycetota bacterium]|nr:hypothetical protein [Planctomycetota bacterium]
MRSNTHLGRLFALLALAPAPSAQGVTQTLEGEALGGEFGSAVAGGGDVNGDNVGDFIVGAPFDSANGLYAGRAVVYSGASGAALFTLAGSAAGEQFGSAVAILDDWNNDGRDEFAVGAPSASGPNGAAAGKVVVYDGIDGSPLVTLDGATAGENFGRSIVRVGTLGGLPHTFAVGAPFRDGPGGPDVGAVGLFRASSVVFPPLKTYFGTSPGEHSGWSIAAADVTGDNQNELVIGSPDFDGPLSAQGRVRVLDAITGAQLQMQQGPIVANERFGYAVAYVGDVNSDGRDEYACASPFLANGFVGVYRHDGALLDIVSGLPGARFGFSLAGGWGSPSMMFVGAPLDSTSGPEAGRFYAYHLDANGATLAWTVAGAPGERFGSAVATVVPSSFAPIGQVVGGAPRFDGAGDSSGRARLMNRDTGATIHVVEGSAVGAQTGAAVCSTGDVDGDGVPDYAVGSPLGAGKFLFGAFLPIAGNARVLSGHDGSQIRFLGGGGSGDRFGASLASGADLDGDGLPEIVVGAPAADTGIADSGEALVFGASSGASLFAISGFQTGSELGASVALGDVNGDGIADVGVGMPGYSTVSSSDAGRVRVISGANGVTVLDDVSGSATNDRLGASIAMADITGDGRADVVVGVPGADAGGSDRGAIWIVDGSTGAVVLQLSGTSPGDRFGSSVAVVGDVDLDGRLDFAGGAPTADGPGATNGGYVSVQSGAWAYLIWKVAGSTDDFLGTSVAAAGDVDLDGRADFLAGASEFPFFGLNGPGYVRLYSGRTGALVHATSGALTASSFGAAAAGIGDVDDDGIPDAVVGAPTEAPVAPFVFAGAARVVSMRPKGVSFYGASTPGCDGPQQATTMAVPKLGSTTFGFTCDHAPTGALGLGLLTDVQDLAGTDLLGIGLDFHVGLFGSLLLDLAMQSDATGHGLCPLSIPGNPAFAGVALYFQAIFLWNACSLPTLGLSATSAVRIELQP